MLNKQNINPSANAKSNEFLRETITRNVLSLRNSKKVLLQATGSTSHGNHHSAVGSFPDVCYLIKLLASESAFHEQLGRGSGESLLPDLFINGTALLAKGIILADYMSNLQGNWDTKGSSYNTSGNRDNVAEGEGDDDTVKREGRDLENNDEIDN